MRSANIEAFVAAVAAGDFDQFCRLLPAPCALETPSQSFQRSRAADFRRLVASHRPSRAAPTAVDPQAALEPDEVGDGSDMFGGHSSKLRLAERFGNIAQAIGLPFPVDHATAPHVAG